MIESARIQENCISKYLFLYYIISLDLQDYDEYFSEFNKSMDTVFRIEVLKNQEFFLKKKINWSEKTLFENISIGLRCKDENLQLLTLDLINKVLPLYKPSQIKEITKLLTFCKFEKTLLLIREHKNLFIENDLKGFFKFFFVFCEDFSLRKSTFLILRENFKVFCFKKLCTEMLPFLCEMIIETPSDELFDTTRAILDHLQENRESIGNIEIKTRMQKWLPFLRRSKSSEKTSEKTTPEKTTPLNENNMSFESTKETSEDEKWNEDF